MDVKTLSAMLGHVSAATTLDIYTHITDDMRLTAAANIDRGIGKTAPQEGLSEPGQETAPAQAEKPCMTDFKPYVGRKRRSGTGCISEINDHLFEGRYSPKWPDGKSTPAMSMPTPARSAGEAKGADRGDEGRNRGSAAADGFGRGRWAAAGGAE